MNLIVCLVQHEHNYLPVGNAPEHSVYRVCFKHNLRVLIASQKLNRKNVYRYMFCITS